MTVKSTADEKMCNYTVSLSVLVLSVPHPDTNTEWF